MNGKSVANCLRWTLANIAGTTVGLTFGVPIALFGFSFAVIWLDFDDYSGIPCDDRAFPTMILMGIIGGVVGGIVGYFTAQKLIRDKIIVKHLIRYALLGGFLWPAVAIFSIALLVTFGFAIGGRLGSAIDFFLPSNQELNRVHYRTLFARLTPM
jgi:hypothetical protein